MVLMFIPFWVTKMKNISVGISLNKEHFYENLNRKIASGTDEIFR